jgi:tetratricopeptide (TPR) repeat protein
MQNFDEALAAARHSIDLNKRKAIRYGEELAYSTLGSVYFTLNDFENARANYLQYMDKLRPNERVPNLTFLRAGMACEIAGDRASAVLFYRKMKEPEDQNRAWDNQNYRRGLRLLQKSMTEGEMLIVKGGNEATQKKYTNAVRLYNDALNRIEGDVDLQARALYGMLQAQVDGGMLSEGSETANRLLALRPSREDWIIPHGWFKLGQIRAARGQTTEARVAFDRIDDYDDYDFQERLERERDEEVKKLGRVQ